MTMSFLFNFDTTLMNCNFFFRFTILLLKVVMDTKRHVKSVSGKENVSPKTKFNFPRNFNVILYINI